MKRKQQLSILGSTGSIGTQTLEIIRQNKESFEVFSLTANKNWKLLAEQVQEFTPKYALICDESHYEDLKKAIPSEVEVLVGSEYLPELASHTEVDIVLNALMGFAGFESTLAAIMADKKVALANKESLVVGGELITKALKCSQAQLIPVDSEHSAMLQCMAGEDLNHIDKIIITASGGPFRDHTSEQMKNITVKQALNHPNWEMGAKITIDSATMMNKGLEIIEAHWLFHLPIKKIQPVIHPQSIIHSIITFIDGSSKAQLGLPDMKVPIIYALGYPERLPLDTPAIKWDEALNLEFQPIDFNKFPCLKLAMESIESGGYAPAVLNAANEIAVERFLNKEIDYIHISEIVESCLENIHSHQKVNTETLKEIDKETRKFARSLIN